MLKKKLVKRKVSKEKENESGNAILFIPLTMGHDDKGL
jgi:hypothetical protein